MAKLSRRIETGLRFVSAAMFVALGLLQLCWIGYNLFVERLPETQGRDPLSAIKFSAVLIAAGIIIWVRR